VFFYFRSEEKGEISLSVVIVILSKKGRGGRWMFFWFFLFSVCLCFVVAAQQVFLEESATFEREKSVFAFFLFCTVFSCPLFFKFSLLFFPLGELLFTLHTFRNRAAELRGPKVLLIVGGGFYRPFSSQCIFCLFSLFLSTLLLKWRKEKTEQQFFILERRGRIGGDTQERAFVTEQGAHTRTRK